MGDLSFTLITGACKGIGKALAYECASRGLNVLLVSNDNACVQSVCEDIKLKQVECHCLAVDLTDDDAPLIVSRWISTNNFKINMLVNNVGIGKGGTFGSMNMSDMQYMMKLNNKVLVELTYCLLPMLKQHSISYILNLSSLEATLPLPYKAVYTATKNFVYAFSLAIAEELKFSNVNVSVVCPGPVLTNAEGLSRMTAHGTRSKVLMMYPEEVARIAFDGLLKRKRVIVPGFINSIFFKLGSLLPVNVKMNLLEKLFRVYKTS
jgi:short-subunit dehydrogenase